MCDIILTEYERMKHAGENVRETVYGKELIVLAATIILLVLNQLHTENPLIQLVLNLTGFVTALILFYGRRQREQTTEEYARDLQYIERVLYFLEIDTLDKILIVADEVKVILEESDRKRKRVRWITGFFVLTLAGMVTCVCLYRRQSMNSYMEVGSALNFFLMLAALLFACAYVFAQILSGEDKYNWLYDMLLGVIITKY